MGQAREDALAKLGGVLADAGRHHHGVGARHGRVEAADGLLDAVDVHVDGEIGVFVALRCSIEHVAHVAACTGNAQDAALAVQYRVHLVEGPALAAHDVGDDGRVDRARTRSHHEALERREAHGGVDGLAVVHGRDRPAVAQVAGNEPQVAHGPPEKVCGLLGGVAVARAVRAVAADLVLVVVAHGQRVHVGLRRHGLVEGGVEDGSLRG